jgi:hypothetical protein
MFDLISYLGYALLRRSLLTLLVLGGIVFAIVRWKRHPRASLLTVIALGFYLIETWVATIFFYYLPYMMRSVPPGSQNTLYTVIYFIEDFGFAAVLVLLVAAAFTGRRPATIND